MVATHAQFDDAMNEEEYRRFALGDPQGRWELHDGRLREKPPMSVEHGDLMVELTHQLRLQLDRGAFRLRTGHARVRVSAEKYYVPDVAVIPTGIEATLRRQPGSLDAYIEPLPLVVEIWSPSTGGYDVDTKVPEYMDRGHMEIWRLHPFERTLTAWVRRPDGTYAQAVHRGGIIRPTYLPAVGIDLDVLFQP
jgi:Uma2 family endonuclease